MTIRNLRWLEGGPIRLDVDSPLLLVGVTRETYPESFPGNVLITTGGGLHDGQYLAADALVLEEYEVGVIFRDEIPAAAGLLSTTLGGSSAEHGEMDVWLTGEVVQGKFLVQDIIVGEKRLIREELQDTLKQLKLESIDDQFLGYH